MQTNVRKAIFVSVFIITAATIVHADERTYVWTYEYQTLPRGVAELEHYLTFTSPELGEFEGTTTVEHQIEYEFGMNDRFDVGIYQVFKQKPGESLTYNGFKVRGRYRFGEKNMYFMDPLIYVEYKNKPDFSEHAMEVKFILAKDIGRFNIALNPYFEVEEGEEETEFTPKYAAGLSYALHDLFKIGVEFKGSEKGHYIGPTIAHGNDAFYVAVGALFKAADVDPGEPEFQMRSIIGIKF
jgi:hypothetical protein